MCPSATKSLGTLEAKMTGRIGSKECSSLSPPVIRLHVPKGEPPENEEGVSS